MIPTKICLKSYQCKIYTCILFISYLVQCNETSNALFTKLSQTIQILAKAGYCIDQIHPSGKFLIATKNRASQNKLWIKSYDNKPIHLVESQIPFQVLSGGIGGFCWTYTATLNVVDCYRLSNKEKYCWTFQKATVKDFKMYEKGDVVYYKYSEKEPNGSLYGIIHCLNNGKMSQQIIPLNISTILLKNINLLINQTIIYL